MVEIEGFELKEELYYWKKAGTWAKVEEDGNVRVGLADVVTKTMPKITAVRYPPKIEAVKQGGKLATVVAGKASVTVKSPVSGKVLELNKKLKGKNVIAVQEDPYGEGWIALIKPDNLEEDLKNLVKGDSPEAAEWYKGEIAKRKKEKKK